MVYFGVSSYFFNTASFAYHTAGALVFEITDSMVRRRGGMGQRLADSQGSSAPCSPPHFPMELRWAQSRG